MSTCAYPECRSEHSEMDGGANFHTWTAAVGDIHLDLSLDNGQPQASWMPEFDYFGFTEPTIDADLAALDKLIADLQAAATTIREHFAVKELGA
jgi:hypothetical protein